MCGIYIVAEPKTKTAGKQVFAGLQKIEYRGYDSWGVATLTSSGFKLEKQVGKLALAKKIQFPAGRIALGHTRWATHGGVTQVNAHPHLAKNGSFVLAQNGVVENFQEIHAELVNAGYECTTQTDTEGIVGLLELAMQQKNSSELDESIVMDVFLRLQGRNTIVIATRLGTIYALRNGSPLVVGRQKKTGAVYFSSDSLSLSGIADEYLVVESGQMMVCRQNNLLDFSLGNTVAVDSIVFDLPEKNAETVERAETNDTRIHKKMKTTQSKSQKKPKSQLHSEHFLLSLSEIKSGKPLPILWQQMDLEANVAELRGFSSFMYKEIHEQAEVLHKVLAGKELQFMQVAQKIRKAQTVFVLGAGSASFAAQQTAFFLRNRGIHAIAVPSYEADSYRALFSSESVCIVYSQSGETADTNEVVEEMKTAGVHLIGVVNMQGSTLARLVDTVFFLDIGPEQAVASTKAFLGHLVWGMTIYLLLCNQKFIVIEEKIKNIEQILYKWLRQKSLREKMRNCARTITKKKHLFVLGRGALYPTSLESALKLKEVSYIHAEGFSGGELKHGVIALIEPGTPVLCLVAEDETKPAMINAIAEVTARGGYTIVVSSTDNELYGEWIEMPEEKLGDTTTLSLLGVVPAQVLTCFMAEELGFDVDKPRNLAKSVTVK